MAALSGLSFASTKAHVARAALEAQAYQAHDLKSAFAADGVDWAELRIDGGMAANDWMAQDLADMLNVPVERPDFVESTALGAAMLAATGAGAVSVARRSGSGAARYSYTLHAVDRRHHAKSAPRRMAKRAFEGVEVNPITSSSRT